jgi:hypothetical protein
MKILVILACAVLLVGCGEKVTPEFGSIAPGTNTPVEPIELRIRTNEELQRIYADAGVQIPEGRELRGFIGRDLDTGRTVIYLPPPKYVDDDVTCSLGHEVMHAAFGKYHRVPQ